MNRDALYVAWNGGGGLGDPLERDPEQVRADVARHFVSREAARDVYGVALDPSGALDADGTRALRARMRSARIQRSAAE
jgi:N-methylhydantoinase B